MHSYIYNIWNEHMLRTFNHQIGVYLFTVVYIFGF